MMSQICVCVPTYKRPSLLDRCIDSLLHQQTDGFSYSILVVDNDLNQSGLEIVRNKQHQSPIELRYCFESVKNISLARNRAVNSSQSDIIAFIDDDEMADSVWLAELYRLYAEMGVDGVLGPVLPYFEGTPPRWLIRSGLCLRTSFPTRTVLKNPKYMRTGNVLLSRRLFANEEPPFDPRFGLLGGEDVDFFSRMHNKGAVFVWCQEGVVYEYVPVDRQKRFFYVRRALVRGVNTARRESFLSMSTLKSFGALMAYTVILPIFLVGSHPLFMKFLIKYCDHLSKLLAYLGVLLVRIKPFH